jgi:hypothetical protein
MFGGIQTILEKLLDLAGGELRRRQADVVDDQQGDFAAGAFIEVGRWADLHPVTPPASGIQLHTDSFNADCVGAQYAVIGHRRAITWRD